MFDLNQYITDVPNYPKEGIVFKDITTLLENARAFGEAIEQMKAKIQQVEFDTIVAIESRGFIFGAPLAYALGRRLVVVRKKGKLPRKAIDVSYALEYGEDTLSIHEDSLSAQNSVVIVDDLLATGGTMRAVCQLVEKTGASVNKILVFMELAFLHGAVQSSCHEVLSVLK